MIRLQRGAASPIRGTVGKGASHGAMQLFSMRAGAQVSRLNALEWAMGICLVNPPILLKSHLVDTCSLSQHKSTNERSIDGVEPEHPDYASTRDGDSRAVWYVKRDGRFPYANSAAGVAISDYM